MELVKLREAAVTLGVSRPTLYRLLAKHGMTTLFRPGDREAYVDLESLRRLREQFEPRKKAGGAANE